MVRDVHTSVVLQVAEHGLTPAAIKHAEGALMALSDSEMMKHRGPGSGASRHIMLSYQVRARSCDLLSV
eukprot:COSAG01_NODE_53836_length_336_cov_0.869198_1_plen_68_part_10